MNIVSPYPYWYILFCILLGAIYGILLYRKDKRLEEFRPAIVVFLASLRFVSVTFLAILLLSPLIKHLDKKVEEPIVIFAIDNSASMKNAQDSSQLATIANNLNELKSELSNNYDIHSYLFDNEVEKQENVPTYNGLLTNYDAVFEEFESRFVNRNVAAILLYSDGLYNRGNNPIYLTERTNYPIYTIAAGDSNSYKDASVQQIRNNELAFLGNDFPVEFDIQAQKAEGSKLKVIITHKNQQVFQKEVVVQEGIQTFSFSTTLEAKDKGIQQYTIQIEKIEGERNTINNTKNFYIDVIDGRQKIALIYTAAHPDIFAIRKSLEKNKNYQLTTMSLEDFDEKTLENDLLILHQSKPTLATLTPKIDQIIRSDLPLFVMGSHWSRIEAQFGIQSKGSNPNQKNEVFPSLNPKFSLFGVSENLMDQLNEFPPIQAPFDQLTAVPPNTTLLYQKIGAVETKYPLLAFVQEEERKLGRFMGEGIWKWALKDFVDNESHENFDEWIGKMIQFLAVKSDRSYFRLNVENEVFENEKIKFNAQLFNPSYELVNDGEVELQLIDENGKEYDFIFNRMSNSYSLNIGPFPRGKYFYRAKTTLAGRDYLEEGSVLVKALEIEQITTKADHNLLFQLAEKTGGKMLYPNQIQDLAKLLDQREDIASISYQIEEVEEIIRFKWIFFVIALLFFLEWFLRKRNGAY